MFQIAKTKVKTNQDISEKAEKVRKEGKCLCAVCRKSVDSNSILCNFASVRLIKDSLVLKVKSSRMGNLNIALVQVRKETAEQRNVHA